MINPIISKSWVPNKYFDRNDRNPNFLRSDGSSILTLIQGSAKKSIFVIIIRLLFGHSSIPSNFEKLMN